jgi:Kef-type K+ transport system membrane component KefB
MQSLTTFAALLLASVLFVPLFKRAGLGTVLGYLAVGMLIGPFGIKLVRDPDNLMHTAELGVILLLFVIGLELKPSRLWALRRSVFGLGVLQLAGAAVALAAAGRYLRAFDVGGGAGGDHPGPVVHGLRAAHARRAAGAVDPPRA